jgi:hypothetical protein
MGQLDRFLRNRRTLCWPPFVGPAGGQRDPVQGLESRLAFVGAGPEREWFAWRPKTHHARCERSWWTSQLPERALASFKSAVEASVNQS